MFMPLCGQEASRILPVSELARYQTVKRAAIAIPDLHQFPLGFFFTGTRRSRMPTLRRRASGFYRVIIFSLFRAALCFAEAAAPRRKDGESTFGVLVLADSLLRHAVAAPQVGGRGCRRRAPFSHLISQMKNISESGTRRLNTTLKCD